MTVGFIGTGKLNPRDNGYAEPFADNLSSYGTGKAVVVGYGYCFNAAFFREQNEVFNA